MNQGYKGTDHKWQPEVSWIQETVCACLEQAEGLTEKFQFLKEKDQLDMSDLSDGYLNDVVRVSSRKDPSKTVIVKHAPPYIKGLGPEYPLTDDRGDLEYRALVRFNEACPGSVVRPLGYHDKNKVLCLEDYPQHVVYRKWLLAGNVDENIARKLARDIAIVHRKTHVATLGQGEFDALIKEFRNPALSKITDDFIFSKPFSADDPTNHWSVELEGKAHNVHHSPEILDVVRAMHKLFQEKKEALIHGDLHTGSALVGSSGQDIRMFDLEFAMVGPCAMDLGLLIANYIFCYYHHLLHEEDNDSHRKVAYKLIDICNITVDEYLQHMSSSVGDREQYVEQLVSETAGFAGCEILSKLLGAGRVEDMDKLESAQPDCFDAGCRLLSACHRIHNVSQLMFIALALC